MNFDTTTILIAFGLTLFAGLSTGIGSLIAFTCKRTNTRFLSVALGFSDARSFWRCGHGIASQYGEPAAISGAAAQITLNLGLKALKFGAQHCELEVA